MKTLRHLSLLLVLVCSTMLVNAQCGINAGFYQNLNPNQVPWFHDTTTVNSGWQITNYYWSFGDGSTSTLINPTHVYPHPGAYNVCHYVQASDNNGNNCIDTVCQLIQVGCTGVVQATISASVQNNIVVFTGTGSSNYPPVTYYWQFPGGTPATSTTAVTTVQYANSGSHPAYLTVTDSNGCSKSVTQTVTTTSCGNVVANFNTTLSGQAGTTVYMVSSSTGTNTNTLYQWKLDGNFITNPNPNTGYSASNLSQGSHTICLYVYANSNTLCDTICKTIYISGCNVNLNAGFQYVITNNTVVFETSYGIPTQQTLWDFGDGNRPVDTSYRITHTFPSNPTTTTYYVCHYLWVGNTTCSDTFCQAVVIPGTNALCGEVNFTRNTSGGSTILTATSSVSGTQTYYWAIKNNAGTAVQTGGGNPFTVATLPTGTYTACVYLFNSSQVLCDSLCDTLSITASPCSVAPHFTYTLSGNTLNVNAGTNYPSGTWYSWTINSASSGTAPTYQTYSYSNLSPGTYSVCLTLWGNQGTVYCDSTCQTITVPGVCGNVSFTSNNSFPTVLTASSTGTGTQYYTWTIKNNNGATILTGSGNPVTITSLATGTYQACVFLYNSNQQLCDSNCHSITVTTPTCITLQPNGAAGKDAEISTTAPTGNDGNATSVGSASWTTGGVPLEDRGLLQFDLSSIPAGSTITSARLSLYADNTSPWGYTAQPTFGTNNASYLKRITSAWTETGVTWNTQPTTTATGQITLAQSTSVSQSYTNIDVSAFAQQWVNTPSQNYGMLIDMITTAYNNSLIFGSSDHADSTKRPKLEICYVPATCASYLVHIADTVINGQPTLVAYPFSAGPYTYNWSNGATTQSITALTGSVYCVTVTNGAGCTATKCDTVSSCGTASFTTTQTAGHLVLAAASTGSQYVWAIRNMNGIGVQTGSGNPFTTNSLATGTYQVCLYLYNSNQTLCDTVCQTVTVNNGTCITLRPNGAAGKDAEISTANVNANDGNSTNLGPLQWTINSVPFEGRGMLQFDLSAIPAGSTITAARLSLTADNNSAWGYVGQPTYGTANASYLKRITSAWTESAVTWSTQPTTTTTGQVLLAQSTSTNQSYNNLDVSAFAQQWVNNPAQNYGMMLDMIGTAFYNGLIFCSSDHADSTKRPRLEICYTPCTSFNVGIVDNGLIPNTSYHLLRVDTPSAGGPFNYAWSDGSVGYDTEGQIGSTYCVTVTNNVGCSATACYYLDDSCHVASFTSTQNTGYLVLTGTSAGTGNQYVWAIRDMNGNGVLTGSGSPFTANGLGNGTYQVCMYLYNHNQTLCDTICQTIAVTTPCNSINAQWTSSNNSNHTVTFVSANQYTSGVYYHWNFGDGGQSTDVSPTHGYTVAGSYTACLIISLPNFNCSDTFCHTIVVDSVIPCTAVASVTASVNPNGVYELVAHYSGSNITYAWNTGATTSAISTTAPGTYCVTVTNSINCSATACYTVVSLCGTASFNGVVTNNSINAISTSTGSAVLYYWNLYSSSNTLLQTQSGQSGTFNTQTLTSGVYRICLYLYSNNSTTFCDSTCEHFTVVDSNACANLSAIWTPSYTSGNGVHFIGVGVPGNTTHYWSFGDGSSSSNGDPTHYYTSAGLYTVCHIVSIANTACADTFCQSIQANAGNPCTGFAVHINQSTSIFGTHTMEAVATGGGTPYTYSWSNGDTTQSIHPTFPGTYCVTVYNNSQCSATDCEVLGNNTPACNAAYSYAYVNCNTVHFANASTGGYTNQTWYFGDGTSSSAASPTHSFAAGTWTVQLTVYSNGTNCQSTYYQVITIQPCGVYDTICGVVFNDVNGNGVQDNGEQGLSGAVIHAGNYTATANANGEYHLVLPVGTYTLYYCAPTGNSFTIPVGTQNPNSNTTNCASYTISTNGGHHCGYNFGVQNNSVNICGRVYNDANNNHTYETGETGITNVHVILVGSNGQTYHAYTSQGGEYCVTLPAGTYNITIVSPIGGVVTPQSIILATVVGGSYNHNDFGVYVQPGSCNLNVTITPHTTVTAGEPAWYDVRVCNVGASLSSGTVNLFYDPTLIFNSSQPAQTSVNTSTHTISWTLSNLAPGACESYWVTFHAATTTQVGQHVFMLANVTTTNCNETDYTNNVDTTHQNATLSWDPNNKLVLPAGEGEEGKIVGNEELTYTINFQNTGNAPAVNVVLRDMIDQNLDLETFHMLGASHPYTMQFAGREAIWKFNAIMLPDSTTNEAESHGHVTFAITPLAGLADGIKLNNTANIYFDYNTAVTTNTTLNTIDYKLAVEDLEGGKTTITLMPNPFKDYTTIRIEGENSTYELHVFDMVGKLVQREITTNNTFTVEGNRLAAGMYMYEIVKNNKVVVKGKMIAAE